MSTGFCGRIVYRCGQFAHMVWPPEPDPTAVAAITQRIPSPLRPLVRRLHPGDLAHLLRLTAAIAAADLAADVREELLDLAAVHDLGKALLRPTLFERVVKVLLPLPRRGHALAGARLVRRVGAPPRLCRRVAHHHDEHPTDPVLVLFQRFDDRC